MFLGKNFSKLPDISYRTMQFSHNPPPLPCTIDRDTLSRKRQFPDRNLIGLRLTRCHMASEKLALHFYTTYEQTCQPLEIQTCILKPQTCIFQ